MKLVDKKCKCGKVYYDLFDDELDKCECGKTLERMFGSIVEKPFPAGMYENFDDEPIYIESKKQFQQEADKRGLVRVF